jgi:SAM-dependent methyltransferase
MKRTHARLVEWETRFPAGHRQGYDGFREEVATLRGAFYDDFLTNRTPRQPNVNEVLACFDDMPPAEFTAPYPIAPEVLESLAGVVQRKYIMRFKNVRRSWAHLLQYMPELMAPGATPRRVLEMSTAHGATLEVLRHKGHDARGNDFANFIGNGASVDTRFRRIGEVDLTQEADTHGQHSGDGRISDWPYRPIIEAMGLPVDLFDAGSLPYPYADQSFDCVLCFDAIEHYCHPKDWLQIIGEFVRLARESVLLITNPVQAQKLTDDAYMTAFHDFQAAMRSYDRGGMRCVMAGVHRHQLTVFKLIRTTPHRPDATKPRDKARPRPKAG